MAPVPTSNASTDRDRVILVNERDEALGVMDKLEAHKKGLLHRAISVFVFNDAGEMLLQQRALGKYHSPGLWTNTCCSHPREGEEVGTAAHRRLQEEMGFDCLLEFAFHFTYQSQLDNRLIEHEFDHVFTGIYNEAPRPQPAEVMAWQFLSVESVRKKLQTQPDTFTAWFRIVFERVVREYFG